MIHPLPQYLCTLACALAAQGPPGEAARVTGDADAAVAFADMLRHAEDNPPETGRLAFRCTYSSVGEFPGRDRQTHRAATVGTVVWAGRNVRWDYKSDQAGTALPGGDREPDPRKAAASVMTPRVNLHWTKDDGIIQVRPAVPDAETPPQLQVRPHDGWFRPGWQTSRTWAEMLDPRDPLPGVQSIAVDRQGTEVTVTLGYAVPGTFTLVGDLARGVVTEYNYEVEGGGRLSSGSGRGTWEAVADGPVRPAVLHRQKINRDGDDVRTDTWHLEVTEYEPDFVPPESLFTLRGLGAPKTAEVRYHDAAGRLVQAARLSVPRSADDEADAVIERLAAENAGDTLAGGAGE